MEESFGGGLCSVDAFSHFCNIEIDLHYSPFAPDFLYKYREIGFESFSDDAPGGEEEDVFGGLLRYGAGSSQPFPFLFVVRDGLVDLFPVESVVRVEQVVLAGDYCTCHFRRDFPVADPGLARVEILVVNVLDAPLDHQWRNRYRNPLECHDP